jgi:hypothetical protein
VAHPVETPFCKLVKILTGKLPSYIVLQPVNLNIDHRRKIEMIGVHEACSRATAVLRIPLQQEMTLRGGVRLVATI